MINNPRKTVWTSTFRQDVKRLQKWGKDLDKLEAVVAKQVGGSGSGLAEVALWLRQAARGRPAELEQRWEAARPEDAP